MGSGLHQTLKSLCFNTEWSYAVFWKLKHQAPMVLAWGDAYYNSCGGGNLSGKCLTETLGTFHDGNYSHNLLGLAVAMMSSHVYPLGEGIVGQVAVTGKHKWIVADNLSNNSSCSSFEYGDAWQNQFSAGIRTIAVVSVVPHGVLQLGSLNEVVEDTKLITHIRNLFFALHATPMASNTIERDTENPLCSSNLPRKFSTPVINLSNYEGETSGSKNVRVNDSSIMKIEEDKFQTESMDTFLKFSAGCELYEALGPAFQKKIIDFDWERGKIESGTSLEAPLEMRNNNLRSDSGSEHLLEAVVASFCHSGSENMQEPCLNSSELSMSSKGFSSPCPSTCSEQLERSSGPGKNKKRARPGESCRPRPRDRQLIQDRIKELRELVPSGSKCSIDSLLERTIKHMLFLQSITKHADKLNKCSDMKSHSKEAGMHGSSSCEQGSSWAVEVGSHLKVCSIVVENLDKNGQMLVEMLCEECSHFLEIAEAIRSLGLTILKGVTEARGDKTWICFVVEGQNNRSIHRMDVLWSLVQVLQPNAAVQP